MISAFEVAQFVNDEQSWRELADPRKFPLPPDLEPECELDIRPSQRVPEPTLLLVEFDQIVGQNILLTQPTLATSAVDRLNESLQVVFGVNYQEATAMSHFSIVPESTSVFPDIEFPTYARYFTVYDVEGRGLVRNCCLCFLACSAHQLYKYMDCMEAQLTKLFDRLTTQNLTMFWRALHSRLRNLQYTRDLLAIYLANPDSLAERLQPDEIRTLALTDQAGLDSSMAAVCTAIQVVSEFATSSAAAAEVSDGAAARLAACLEAANEKEAADSSPPTLVKIMSIHASDAKREMKPIWMLLGMDRDELTGLMAEVVKQTVKASDDDQWAWSLPSLLGEVLEQLLLCRSGAFGSVGGGSGGSSRTAAVSGDRGQLSNFRSRVGSMASSTCGGGGGTASIDSFKSLASCRDDTATASTIAAAAAAAAGGNEFHSVGSSNASSMERIYAREWSWTVTNGEDTEMSLQIGEALRRVPPVFPDVTADAAAVLRFVAAYARYPQGVAQAVHCLLQGRRLALLCRTEDEARLLQQALALFVPFADSSCRGPWFSKLPGLPALAAVPIACVQRPASGQLPNSASLQRLLSCLDVAGRRYSGPEYQGGALSPLFGADIAQCALRSQEFAVRLVDLIFTELAQLTLTVTSMHLARHRRLNRPNALSARSSAVTSAPDSQKLLANELAKFGISQDDYLIGMHLSKTVLGRLSCSSPETAAAAAAAPAKCNSSSYTLSL
ncbi:hypothetical protein BOX15_Mlig006915g1 [Macrostomum lignano]|uniref:UDENN FLCN/SMCR8-type domain-containing protein n=2 Tax=Macrostomum lignano TaxID=282301 RepID=A0A267GIL7_9PLAT|nr:hypothetical protein BOX15_Mlig006915g1 [Macrostomum lignano]